MLTILVYEDGRLSLDSDDANAENIRVLDAFEAGHEDALADQWACVPAVDGGVQMMVAAEDSKRALEALEEEFYAEVDEAWAELKAFGL